MKRPLIKLLSIVAFSNSLFFSSDVIADGIDNDARSGKFRLGSTLLASRHDIDDDSFTDDSTVQIGVGFIGAYDWANGFGLELNHSYAYFNPNIIRDLVPGTDNFDTYSNTAILGTYTFNKSLFFMRGKAGIGRWLVDYGINIDPQGNSLDREYITETGYAPQIGIVAGMQFRIFEFGAFVDYQSDDFIESIVSGYQFAFRF